MQFLPIHAEVSSVPVHLPASPTLYHLPLALNLSRNFRRILRHLHRAQSQHERSLHDVLLAGFVPTCLIRVLAYRGERDIASPQPYAEFFPTSSRIESPAAPHQAHDRTNASGRVRSQRASASQELWLLSHRPRSVTQQTPSSRGQTRLHRNLE